MAPNKRLKQAQRQLVLARIARRDAMTALAASLSEEARSASLAERSRAIARDYAERSGAQTGAAINHQMRFAAELASLAKSADQARGDAARQAEWQMDALAKAEQRMERLDERAKAAKAEQRHTQERVDQPESVPVARKLQNLRAKAPLARRNSG